METEVVVVYCLDLDGGEPGGAVGVANVLYTTQQMTLLRLGEGVVVVLTGGMHAEAYPTMQWSSVHGVYS